MARVLVVDDDAGVNGTIKTMLFGTGHEVMSETNSKLVAGIVVSIGSQN